MDFSLLLLIFTPTLELNIYIYIGIFLEGSVNEIASFESFKLATSLVSFTIVLSSILNLGSIVVVGDVVAVVVGVVLIISE